MVKGFTEYDRQKSPTIKKAFNTAVVNPYLIKANDYCHKYLSFLIVTDPASV